MATFALIPGAGGQAWYWHRLVPELTKHDHEALAIELPASDDSAGLSEYADVVVDAIGERSDVVLVAQSLGGFTAPLVCERRKVDLLVMLNAMMPSPGEPPGDWWRNTHHSRPHEDFDPYRDFFHDVPPDITAEAIARGETPQSSTPFAEPWPLQKWPDVPTRFLQGFDDRFFSVGFQQRVVRNRLGIDLDQMPGGHLVALSRPAELAERLIDYFEEVAPRA
ncbi:alpha/beta hydrolase [Amycolatopsis acidicola]|uniref:Alpha/beta hydrolase n=1 Tax=Amycolatopsis acidicola TaxID=2596893 RepID=A0A5N0UR08_9PSEU|nr:alpha/beta hydrolase [Amycolatopsis acidicola]KAA9153865.1 alpha/beta hydrolase [Amycolatopsis acidicola]